MTTRLRALAGAILTLSVGVAACSQDDASPPASGPFGGARLAFSDDGANAKLAYGIAASRDAGFMLECAHGAGTVHVTQLGVVKPPRLLALTSGRDTVEVPAAVEAFEGRRLLTAQAPAAASPFTAFRRSGRLQVGSGDVRYDVAARDAELGEVRRFFASCGAA